MCISLCVYYTLRITDKQQLSFFRAGLLYFACNLLTGCALSHCIYLTYYSRESETPVCSLV